MYRFWYRSCSQNILNYNKMKNIIKWTLFALFIYAFFFLSNIIIERGDNNLSYLLYRSLMFSFPCCFFFINVTRYIQKKKIILKELYINSFLFYIIQSLIFYKLIIINDLKSNYLLSNIEALILTFIILLIIIGTVKYKTNK